jgi:hypothetical protein
MMNVYFDGAHEIGKPKSLTDEGCSSAWAYPYLQEVDISDEHGNATGQKAQVQAWLLAYQPSKEDMEAIAAGGPIYVNFISSQLVPHSLITLNPATGEPNV